MNEFLVAAYASEIMCNTTVTFHLLRNVNELSILFQKSSWWVSFLQIVFKKQKLFLVFSKQESNVDVAFTSFIKLNNLFVVWGLAVLPKLASNLLTSCCLLLSSWDYQCALLHMVCWPYFKIITLGIVILHSPYCPRTHCVDQANLKLTVIYLPLSSKCCH